MRSERLSLLFLAVIFSVSCSKQSTVVPDKKQALLDYSTCSQLAGEWFRKLDSTYYSYLLSVPTLKSAYITQVESYITEVRRRYGRVTGRQFMGAHIYSNRKLLTYAPDIDESHLDYIKAERSEDGFYVVEPKYFGLRSYRQMFSGLPKGEYVILMYKASVTNKPYAEERLTLWKDPGGSWQAVDYKIADDI
jgi:hypothetical protein